MSSIQFLVGMAHKYQDKLVYVPTGPLTNMAKALEIDPEITHLIGNTTLMGGALTVHGNVTPFTESNINQDPQAADKVFTTQENLTMVGLDVTLRTLLTKKDTHDYGRTIGDHQRLLDPPTTNVAVGVNAKRFVRDFMDFMISVLKA